jgi:hypothetical protein
VTTEAPDPVAGADRPSSRCVLPTSWRCPRRQRALVSGERAALSSLLDFYGGQPSELLSLERTRPIRW